MYNRIYKVYNKKWPILMWTRQWPAIVQNITDAYNYM